jgi:hypothetical protein
MSHPITSSNSTTAPSHACPVGYRTTYIESTEFEATMAEYEQSTRSPEAPHPRYRIRIERSSPTAETIAAILTWHGGVCLDSEAARVFEIPSEAAYDAALIVVRSVYGWTSVEPHY